MVASILQSADMLSFQKEYLCLCSNLTQNHNVQLFIINTQLVIHVVLKGDLFPLDSKSKGGAARTEETKISFLCWQMFNVITDLYQQADTTTQNNLT